METISEALNKRVVKVTFTKRDGTERVMNCTTCEDLVPSYERVTEGERKKNDEVQPVWDIDLKAWRSFRLDSVKDFI